MAKSDPLWKSRLKRQRRQARQQQERAQAADDARLVHIASLSRNARTSWYGLVGFLAFAGVTLLGVQDSDFFAYGVQTDLPLIGVSIPTNLFFWTAPVLIAALYIHLHLYLIKLWKALASMPPQLQGEQLGDRIFPSLVSDWALDRTMKLSEPVTLARIAELSSVVMMWLAGPILLVALWWRSMVKHDELLTTWIAGWLVLSLFVGLRGWSNARRWLRHRDALVRARGWKREARAAIAWTLIASGFGLVSFERTQTDAFMYTRANPGGERERVSLIPLARANLVGAQLTVKPPDWQNHGLAKIDFEAEWRNREGFQRRESLSDNDQRRFEVEWQRRRQADLSQLQSPNLRGADLRNADLYDAFISATDLREANLAGANLWNAQLEGADLRGARLEGADLRSARLEGANLRDAQLQGMDLRRARLEGADLTRAQLEGANLTEIRLDVTELGRTRMDDGVNLSEPVPRGMDLRHALLEEADLWEARLDGANLSEARLSGANLMFARLAGANLTGATMDGADLRHARLERANLSQAWLQGAYLWHARLDGADLRHTRLERANFSQAWLQGANLRNARLDSADLVDAVLNEANLSRARLEGADLTQARLERADLRHAKLEGARLWGARLNEANLSRARLEGAILRYVQLKGANLSHARLEGADLREANLNGALLWSANLRNVQNLTQSQLDGFSDENTGRSQGQRPLPGAIGDDDTILPDGMTIASCWAEVTELPDGVQRPWWWDDGYFRQRALCPPGEQPRRVGTPASESPRR